MTISNVALSAGRLSVRIPQLYVPPRWLSPGGDLSIMLHMDNIKTFYLILLWFFFTGFL
jgi:hypothetical protein